MNLLQLYFKGIVLWDTVSNSIKSVLKCKKLQKNDQNLQGKENVNAIYVDKAVS